MLRLISFARLFVRDERSLAVGLAGVGGLKVGAMLLGVLSTVVLARLLGADRFGQYAFALSTATLITLPFLQGLPVLVLREASRSTTDLRAQLSAQLLRYSFAVVVMAAVVLGAGALLVLARGTGRAFGTDPILTGTALALPLVLVLTLCLSSVLRAKGHAVAGQVPDLAIRPGVFLLLLVIAWYALELDAGSAMGLHLAAAGIALVVAVFRAFRLRAVVGGSRSPTPSRVWTLALLPLSTLAGMQLVNSQIDLVILGLFAPDRDVGIYRVATLLALQVSFMLAIVTAVVAPSFANLHGAGRLDELRRLNRLSARLAMAFGAAVFLVYLLAGRWLLDVAVGAEYSPAYVPLIILSASHAASLWAGTTNVLLTMIGNERDVLACAAVSVCVNISLNLVLVPRFGIVGAACSSAGALLIWRALLSWRLARRLGSEGGPA